MKKKNKRNCCSNCVNAEGYGNDGHKCRATGYGIRSEKHNCPDFEDVEGNVDENER